MKYTLEFSLNITFKSGETETIKFHEEYETERNLINGDRIIYEREPNSPNFIIRSCEPYNNVYTISDDINRLEFVVVSNNVKIRNGVVLVNCHADRIEWKESFYSVNPKWVITFKDRPQY